MSYSLLSGCDLLRPNRANSPTESVERYFLAQYLGGGVEAFFFLLKGEIRWRV